MSALPSWWLGEITIGDAFPGETACPSPHRVSGDPELMARLLRRESAAFGELDRRQRYWSRPRKNRGTARGRVFSGELWPLYDWGLRIRTTGKDLTDAYGTPRAACDVVRAAQMTDEYPTDATLRKVVLA